MQDIECLDERLAPVLAGARLERLCTGARWSEGPVWLWEDQALLWSDIPNNRMLRWTEAKGLEIWRDGVEFTNGHTRDLNGDLLHCSHGLRAIVRTPKCGQGIRPDTPDEIVVDRYQGRRLNSPNDIVVRSDGTIWFTDPPYGILSNLEGHKAPSEQAANHVFCFDPASGELHAATADIEEPNGLAFSPDEQLLYIVAFDVEGMRLSRMRVLAVITPGLADGFRLDRHGWIYTSSENSVQVISPDGTLLGRIRVPEKVANLTFGGLHWNELFITATTSVYRIRLNTQGNLRR